MKAADSSASFFPPGRADTSSSQANLLGSDTRPRKLSNKLTKKRPTLRTGSTPPSFRGQRPANNDDAFIEAMISNVDMIVSKGYEKREEPHQRALAERSPALASDSLAGPYSAPMSSHKNQSSGESSSADRPAPSLKRASSLRDFGSRRDLADPFGRGPPVIIGRAPPGLGNLVDVFGSAIIRHADEPPLKPWTPPKDPTDSIIALYQSPAEDSSASNQTIGRNDPTRPPVPAEKDDTIIALYKPPPQQADLNLSEPRNVPPMQPYVVAAAPAALASAAVESAQAKLQPLPRASSQRSPNSVRDLSPGSLPTPPLRTRPSEVSRPGVHWQRTPLIRSGTYSREYIISSLATVSMKLKKNLALFAHLRQYIYQLTRQVLDPCDRHSKDQLRLPFLISLGPRHRRRANRHSHRRVRPGRKCNSLLSSHLNPSQ
jgi:hypothetical protein